MEYRQDPKFSFWRRLTSGNFGQKKKEPTSVGRDNYLSRSTSTPSLGQSVNYSLRRSVSREREIPSSPSRQRVNYALRCSVSREREVPTSPSGQSVNYALRRSVSREREIPTSPSGQSVNYAVRRSVSREREIPTSPSGQSVNYALRRSVSREREIPTSPSGQSVNYALRRSVSREREIPTSPSGQSVNYTLRRSVSRERDLDVPSSGQSGNYSLRRSASREREIPPSKGPNATSNLSTGRSQVGDLGVIKEKGGYSPRLSDSSVLKERGIRSGREPSIDRSYREGSYSAGQANRSSSGRYSREPSLDRSYREGSYSGGQNDKSFTRTAIGTPYRPSVDHSSRASSVSDLSRPSYSSDSLSGQDYTSRRNSLQFYYDPGRFAAPKTDKDLSGVRSIYTRNLRDTSSTITGSGRRAPSTSSTYRPIVYTPGSPSPLRRSWAAGSDASSYSSLSASSSTPKMASFMTRNSVFPDFLTSRSSSQHGQATPAYTQDSHESGLEGFKQKTLRLFGNSNTQKNNNNKSYGSGSPVSSNSKSYQSSSQSNGTQKANANGNGSRNIYRQPQSLIRNGGSRNQSADLRRKYFSQRMMWYSEADEDHMDHQDLDRNEKRHHSALELGSVSHSDLLRSDSTQSSSSQESIDRERLQQSARKSTRPSVLKSASFDHYDSLDYRESRGLKEKSPSPSVMKGGRRFSGSSGLGLKLKKQPSVRGGKAKQQTRFSDDVNVVYYDQEEKATALSGADTIHEQEKLKEDKTTSSTITESTVRLACTLHPGQMCGYNNLARLLASNQTTAATEKAQEIQNNENNEETTMNKATDKLATLDVTEMDSEGNMVRKSVFAKKTFEIVEEEGSHELKLVVPIGPEFIRNRTSVKATSGGKRLIVIGYRNEGEGDTAHVHQYIEKMTLPHPIDAYSVRATMDREGNLKISAPISVTSPADQNNPTSKTTEER